MKYFLGYDFRYGFKQSNFAFDLPLDRGICCPGLSNDEVDFADVLEC
jgi:hypothetical protein